MFTPDHYPILVEGAINGALLALVAFAVRRYTPQILFAVLLLAGGFYVWFALRGGAGAAWVLAELVGVAVYGAVGYRGLRGSLLWLAAGWALHPLWDIPLHFVGPGAAFAPEPYAVACLAYDLVVAAVIAVAAALGIRRTSTTADSPDSPAAASR